MTTHFQCQPAMTDNRDLLVIGGGISGLASAFFLQQKGFKVTLLEAAARVGGNIQSLEHNGFLLERGPNSWIHNRHGMAQLLDDLDLHDECVMANSVAKRRYIAQNGQLVALPDSIGGILTTPMLNLRGKLRLLAEPCFGRATHEESIAEFITRRLGSQCLDWLVDPFVSGIYAGDPKQLSVQAAMPKLYALETKYGSLMRGGVVQLQQTRQQSRDPALTGAMLSFRRGLRQLTESLEQQLGKVIHTNVEVDRINYGGKLSWQVYSGDHLWQTSRLVLAVPANQVARLISEIDDNQNGTIKQAQAYLRAVEYPAVASISMAFKRHQISHPLDGFGALIPYREQRRTLGVLFPSSVFTGRCPKDTCLLTAFIGGARNNEVMTWNPARRQQQVHNDLSDLLGIIGSPLWVEESFWPQAIPQYTLGHLQRVEQIEASLASFSGLYLRSNWHDGVALGDCIDNAWQLAQQAAREYD